MEKLKTSVVTFNRNDGYKEKERFLIHILCLLDTFDEVNYVDWNSPTQSLLYEIIDKVPKTGKLKHFVIPPTIHDLYANVIPNFPKCFGPIAINIALRRTNADWFAVTTCDNIPPFRHELNRMMEIGKNTFYTISRREIDCAKVWEHVSDLTSYRQYLAKTTQPRYYPAKVTPNDNYSLINCPGDFQFAPTKIWKTVNGIEENMFYNCFIDTNIQKKVILAGHKVVPIFDVPMYHMSHDNMLSQAHTTKLHEHSTKATPIYNDAWKWVEYFTTTENTDDWGLNNTDIEFEVI